MNSNTERIQRLEKIIEFYQNQGTLRVVPDSVLNQPKQNAGYHGLNKWYLTKKQGVVFINHKTTGWHTGYGYVGKWTGFFACRISSIVRLATDSEIKEAILKGCEQKGIVEGVRVKGLSISTYTEVLDFKSIKYDHERNALHISVVNDLPMVHALVFDNGTFAQVMKEEKFNLNEAVNTTVGNNGIEPTEEEILYTYYQIDFKNCGSFDGDYTIVETIEDVLGILKQIDSDLDDDAHKEGEKPQVTITGVGMTRKAFAEFLKSCEE